MFQDLTAKLEGILRKLKGQGVLTEKNIAETLREVRRVLLEADVNYKVAKEFVERVQQKAVGVEVLRSITPGQQVVKILYDELVALLGQSDAPLHTANIPPTVIMLVGLQGSGKTTFAGRLALYLRHRGHRPLLVAADVKRPAAIEQLKVVGQKVNVPVLADGGADPVEICARAIGYARQHALDTAIVDTAGRLHIDEAMMQELVEIKARLRPHEILFVADGMTGQDAVNTAKEFLQRLDFDGVVLTKMDGDARGGAALSIRAVTGKPIKFISTGEKFDALEKFYPERMASRILGLGDVVTLVEKAQEAAEAQKAQKLEERLRRQQFTLEDFYDQLQQLKKMGPLDQLLSLIPGFGSSALKGISADDRALTKVEAIVNSMTLEERRKPHIIDGSRRRRIAKGSGTTVQEVNKLLKQYEMMRHLIKQIGKKGAGAFPFRF